MASLLFVTILVPVETSPEIVLFDSVAVIITSSKLCRTVVFIKNYNKQIT